MRRCCPRRRPQRRQDGRVDVAAPADIASERLGGIEIAAPVCYSDSLFPALNHVGVDGFLIGKFAHPQQAVLRLEHHFNAAQECS